MKPVPAFRIACTAPHRVAGAAIACSLLLAAAAATAQQAPLSDASVDELIDKLSQPTATETSRGVSR